MVIGAEIGTGSSAARGIVARVRRTRIHRFAAIALAGVAALGCERDARAPAQPPPAPEVRADAAETAPTYVGAGRCTPCHAPEAERWTGSHHDRAMQEASDATVLGDFANARFEHFGRATIFARRGGRFVVTTEGPDGADAEYEVTHTFGVAPLQQYLLRFPDGRLQALPIAWDARPRERGGQRWMHLQPDERVPPGDVLHWTGLAYNWNSQCADCHSTNLRKGYDPARNAFATTWSDLDVACEACHGPGSRHVAWAEAVAAGGARGGDDGLTVRLRDPAPARWTFAEGAAIAHREPPRASHAEVETCAPCHARRSLLREGFAPGEPLLDAFRPSLLEPGLYEADGQMRDEVYDYGSFLQSRMYAAGVTCSDCHDPHSLALRAEGNATCASCHRAEVFDTASHHRHEPGSAGARCAACHMPARTYMVVDVRHDHSFRVPRPDLSRAIGAPNACTDCHAGKSAEWAADAVARWFPGGRAGRAHYGTALAAGRRGEPGADTKLLSAAGSDETPAIARASALALLADPSAPAARDTLARALGDPDPLLRLGALAAAERLAPPERLAAIGPLLRDPLLAVRAEAARTLADVPAPLWRPEQRGALADGLAAYRATQRAVAERPESHLNLGLLHQRLGEVDAARREYETAIRLAPWFAPGYVNLADLERAAGRDARGEALLHRALERDPANADVQHALGLLLVRSGRADEALAALARAAELAPEQTRYALVWAIALHDRGDAARALDVLAAAHERRPGDLDVLGALAAFSRDAGRRDDAVRWARALVEAAPADPNARALLEELER
jgi:tetratricopeptide (TPR) repeat protein